LHIAARIMVQSSCYSTQKWFDTMKAQIAQIQREMGIQAGVFIGSGNVAKVMGQAAKETKADLVVVGARSLAGRFGDVGYGIIRESPVPVVSI